MRRGSGGGKLSDAPRRERSGWGHPFAKNGKGLARDERCTDRASPAILAFYPMKDSTRRRLTRLICLAALEALGCGASSPSVYQPNAGVVTSRAEGYSDRPSWADANQSLQQNGSLLIIVGYVSIHPEQRLEMGYRAADSYARAELLRFLTTRVVAVLEDRQSSAGAQILQETLEDNAAASVDSWTIAAHYWEKRRSGNQERLHVYSRLEMDSSGVAELLQKALSNSPDLRSKSAQYVSQLSSKWNQIVQSAKQAAETEGLPAGVDAPVWARQGDAETADGFTFVCHGAAVDESKAKALAQARCNEKLCRIFGVQISAKTKVREDLNGISAESEVSEQCESVRVIGRQTTNRGGECAEAGCNFWIRQSYSRAAFEAERQRLEQPTVIQQQVVIQEGNTIYRDPKACEAALRGYSGVDGLDAPAYTQRRKLLTQALKTCQGIDGRDSGLFLALNSLLLDPLPKFLAERGTRSELDEWRVPFAIVPVGWRKNIDTQRFLTDRIQTVMRVVDDAILPMRVLDLYDRKANQLDRAREREVDEVVRGVIAYPFSDRPVKPSHAGNPHTRMLRANPSKGIPFSSRYRDFLLAQLDRGQVPCTGGLYSISQDVVAGYLASDGLLDEREWKAISSMLMREPLDGMYTCFGNLLQNRMDPTVRAQRIREVFDAIVSGRIRQLTSKRESGSGENLALAKSWINHLRPEEQWPYYVQYRERITGTVDRRRELAKEMMRRQFGKSGSSSFFNYNSEARESDLSACETEGPQVTQGLAQVPEASVEDTSVCPCLALPNLSSAARSALVQLWLRGSQNRCKFFRKEEWPGGYAVWPYPKRRWESDAPQQPFVRFSDVLKKESGSCDDAAGIHGLGFTPTIRGVIRGGAMTQVRVTVDIDGELDRFSFRDNSSRWVTRNDVEAARSRFVACLAKAAEGYRLKDDEPAARLTSPRPFWLQLGDQGSSWGYGE